MNLWKPPRRISGPAFVGIGFGILFFFFIIGLAIGEFYPMLTGAIFFVLILLVVLIRWLIERRGASGDDGEPVSYSPRSRVSTSDDIRAGMARAKAQKEAAAAQPAPEAPKEAAPPASPSLPLLELVEKLRTENAQLRQRVRELEQAVPKKSARDAEIEARAVNRLADALTEYKAENARQKEQIETLEAALAEKERGSAENEDLKASPAYQIAALKSRVADLENQLRQSAVSRYRPQWEEIDLSELVPASSEEVDKSGPLYGKKIVFTGELSMPRRDAMQMAANCGAVLQKGLTMKTDFLVCGAQDPEVVGEDGLSGKQEKALRYIREGKAEIKMIDEDEFLRLVSGT